MDQELRQSISLFRFGLISPLVSRKGMSRGEQEAILRDIVVQGLGYPRLAALFDRPLDRAALGRSLPAVRETVSNLSSHSLERIAVRAGPSDAELEAALVTLRKEQPSVSLPVFVKHRALDGTSWTQARRPRKTVSTGSSSAMALKRTRGYPKTAAASRQNSRTICGSPTACTGRRSSHEGKLRKAYLFAVIDDHSRLITNAQFYLAENLDCFRDCLSALEKRGLPRRLYVDYAEEKQMPKFLSISLRAKR